MRSESERVGQGCARARYGGRTQRRSRGSRMPPAAPVEKVLRPGSEALRVVKGALLPELLLKIVQVLQGAAERCATHKKKKVATRCRAVSRPRCGGPGGGCQRQAARSCSRSCLGLKRQHYQPASQNASIVDAGDMIASTVPGESVGELFPSSPNVDIAASA